MEPWELEADWVSWHCQRRPNIQPFCPFWQQLLNTTLSWRRNQMLSKLQTKYWIIKANSSARKINHDCVLSRWRHGTAMKQKMADLPLICVTPDLPPFTHTGLNYFGPIEIKSGCSKVKRYGALFTCLASRAVHLEMGYPLNADSCISALGRFIYRRGQVKEIVSNNATNFAGTECELLEALAHLNLNKIQHSIHAEGIKWMFNPTCGSHHGGVWVSHPNSKKDPLLNHQRWE